MISAAELENRWQRCREMLQQQCPQAGGLVVFSRINIYYLSGTFGNGLFWLPLEGQPVLLCRRGCQRAQLESPMTTISPFSSYKEVPGILEAAGSALPDGFAVEKTALSWSLGERFSRYLSHYKMLPGDTILPMVRAVKSEFELKILRDAGARHARCLSDRLSAHLRAGMSEFDIARVLADLYFQEDNHGILRMETHGEEVFMGYVSIGDSGNYPVVFNGPLGLRGVHPAVPYLGSRRKKWRSGELLTIDNGFNYQAYHTDKTQVFWLGSSVDIPSKVRRAQDCCLKIQEKIANQMKPGAIPSELWKESLRIAEKHGFLEGYMGLEKNKVVFVGHGIGLAIDEYPALAEGFDAPLEAGMTLAVEPKIGLPEIGMVGTENTFEVTPHGGKSLTGQQYDIICID
jgi:Xaa-Pro aminopeptidase